MKTKRFWKISAMVIVLPILLFTLSGCSSDESSESSRTEPAVDTATNETSSSASQNEDENNSSQPASGIFADYTPELVSQAAADDKVVLFFHAQWCSVCKRIESDINANLADIPADTRILLVDFDDETELKNKYGVRQQYTMVQVDNSGEKIDSWNSSFSLDDILTRIA